MRCSHGEKRWYKINSIDLGPKMLGASVLLALGGVLSHILDFRKASRVLLGLGLAVFASLMIIVLIELAQDRADSKRP
jgi:hypothetical protein